MRRGSSWAGVLGFVCAASACSGEEFSSGTGARGGSAVSACTASGGTAGTAGSGGSSASGGSGGSGGSATGGNGGASGAGGAAGNGGDAGGSGSAGASGTGGTGGGAFACGPVGGEPLRLHTTLNNANSITAPATGNATSAAFNPTDFHGGKCANSLLIDAAAEYVQFAESQNILYTKGTVDFWFNPISDEFDGAQRTYLKSSEYGIKTGVLLRKLGTGGENAFLANFSDALGVEYETRIANSAYDLAPNQWIRITVTWNFTIAAQAVRVYFDGVEASYDQTVTGPKDTTLSTTGGLLFIGNDSEAGNTPANGLLDDFKIYASVVTP